MYRGHVVLHYLGERFAEVHLAGCVRAQREVSTVLELAGYLYGPALSAPEVDAAFRAISGGAAEIVCCRCVVETAEQAAYREHAIQPLTSYAQVRYHGSQTAYHGLYRVTRVCGCNARRSCPACTFDAPCAEHVRYSLTCEDDPEQRLHHVRPTSMTATGKWWRFEVTEAGSRSLLVDMEAEAGPVVIVDADTSH